MYKCSCGFESLSRWAYSIHFRYNKGPEHRRIGWVDETTGEVRTVPPSRIRQRKKEEQETPYQLTPKTPEGTYEPKPSRLTTTETKLTTKFEEAAVLTFVPRRFEVNSQLFAQAKLVTEREWGWPVLSPGDWLDTYLYFTMKQRGIILGAYQVVEEKEVRSGSS